MLLYIELLAYESAINMKQSYFVMLNGMISTLCTHDWKYTLFAFYTVVLLAALSSNNKIRYYGCYVFYVLYISTFGLILLPIFMLRPKNVVNLKLAGTVLKHFTKVIGIRWHLRNGHILEEKRGAVIVANHQSILDILGMFNIWEDMGKCTAIAKKELIYVAPFGPVAWMAGLVFIDRGNPKLAGAQLKKASSILHDKQTKLWLFPEGTRNKTGDKLLPFKKGAFRTAIECKAPIIPVVFSPYSFIDSRNKAFRKGDMTITALEPIPTLNLTLADIDSLMAKTYEVMSHEYDRLKDENKQSNDIHRSDS